MASKKAPKPRGRRFKKASYQAFKERPKEERWAMMLTNDTLKGEHKRWAQWPESEEFKALDVQMTSRKLKSSEVDDGSLMNAENETITSETPAHADDAPNGEKS